MLFSTTLCAFVALAASVLAQQNPISQPVSKITAGQANTIKWTSTTPGKVTLLLKKGKPEDLKTVKTIAVVDGSVETYSWKPEDDIEPGEDYAIEIVSASNESNYTGLLAVENSSGSYSSSSASASSSASYASSTSSSATSSSASYSSATSTASSSKSSSSPYKSKSIRPSATSRPYGSYSHSKIPPPMSTGTSGSKLDRNATYSNSTSTRRPYGKTSSTSEPTASSTYGSSAKISAAPNSSSGASGLVRSPLAFVICIFGAIIYLN